jgi:hypothetical protein
MIEKVSSTIKENLYPIMDSGTSSHVIAAALGQFKNLLAKSFDSWQERQLYNNADPQLRKRYDDLLLSKRIQQMEERAVARVGVLHNKNVTPISATPLAPLTLNNYFLVITELAAPSTVTNTSGTMVKNNSVIIVGLLFYRPLHPRRVLLCSQNPLHTQLLTIMSSLTWGMIITFINLPKKQKTLFRDCDLLQFLHIGTIYEQLVVVSGYLVNRRRAREMYMMRITRNYSHFKW